MTATLVPPFVLFLDDGVNVYALAKEAEQDLEAIDVRDSPEWQGFDSQFQGLRLDIFPYERKVLGFAIKEEGVKLRIDKSLSLDTVSDTIMEQMREYLLLLDPSVDEGELEQQTARNLLKRILHNP